MNLEFKFDFKLKDVPSPTSYGNTNAYLYADGLLLARFSGWICREKDGSVSFKPQGVESKFKRPDGSSKRDFFYWLFPENKEYEGKFQEVFRKKWDIFKSGGASAQQQPKKAASPSLPPGWRSNIDHSTGRTYYIGPDNTTSWTPPAAAAEVPPPPPPADNSPPPPRPLSHPTSQRPGKPSANDDVFAGFNPEGIPSPPGRAV
jgi:hypothetical protein